VATREDMNPRVTRNLTTPTGSLTVIVMAGLVTMSAVQVDLTLAMAGQERRRGFIMIVSSTEPLAILRRHRGTMEEEAMTKEMITTRIDAVTTVRGTMEVIMTKMVHIPSRCLVNPEAITRIIATTKIVETEKLVHQRQSLGTV
jgi:hypothetical protein